MTVSASTSATIIDSNGEVLRTLRFGTDIQALLHNIQAGEQYVLSLPPSANSYWHFPTSQFRVKPSPPGDWSVWDPVAKVWIDPRSLSSIKALKLQELLASREADEFGTFTWSGHVFDASPKALARLQLAASGALLATITSSPFSVVFTLADNSTVTLSAPEVFSVMQALGSNIESVHENYRVLREEVQTATTIGGVEGVEW